MSAYGAGRPLGDGLSAPRGLGRRLGWRGSGWREILAAQGPDYLLVNARSRLYLALAQDPGWAVLYRDPGAALFGRGKERVAFNEQGR